MGEGEGGSGNSTGMILFLLLLVLIECFRSITIKNHIEGGMGTRDNIPTENQLVMTISSEGGTTLLKLAQDFMNELAIVIGDDHCELTFSTVTDNNARMILALHCPGLKNKPHQAGVKAQKSPLPLMEQTVSFLKKHHYSVEHFEYLQRIKKPFQHWDGNYESTDIVLKEYFEQVRWRRSHKKGSDGEGAQEKAKPILHGAYIQFPATWGLDRIDMRYGFRDNVYNYDNKAENVDVYVIDTGIRVSHQEFQGRATFLINSAADSVDTDCAGHGTHVASVVGGKTYGAAKNASLWAVKVLDCAGNGDSFTISSGILAVIEHAAGRPSGTRQLASLSLGGDFSITINNAVLSLLTHNILPIVAAGNEYGNACDYSPAVLGQSSGVITVGASTEQDTRPPWSNYGACVSISAPGAEIIGAYYTSDTATVTLSGTSMATPFVTGVAAMVLQQNLSLTNTQVKQYILNWATPGVVSGAASSGGGKNLLYSLIDITTEQPTIVTPAPTHAPPPHQTIPGFSSSDAQSTRVPTIGLPLFFLLLCLLMFTLE